MMIRPTQPARGRRLDLDESRVHSILASLALAACTPATPGERLATCPDLPCQQAALVELAAADPAAARAFVRGVEDPVLQVALVTTLAGVDPALLADGCDDLQDAARQRCRRFVLRPHLSDPEQPSVSEAPRPGGGPHSRLLPVPARLAAQPTEDQAREASEACGADEGCRRSLARDHARRGDAAGAEAACRAAASPADCRFTAAESAIAAGGRAALPTAVSLCAASTHPSGCLTHVAALVAPPASPADAVDPALIADLQATTAALAQALGGGHPGELASSYLTGLWVEAAVGAADQPSGDLLDHLPPSAAPQVRLALARRLVADEASPDLDALTARLEAVLASRSATPVAGPALPVVSVGVPYYLWPLDLPGEEGIPASFALADTRRPLGRDAHEDGQLAVLEALGLRPPAPPATWWLALATDEARSERVRWSAARIVAALDPPAVSRWRADGQRVTAPLPALRLAPTPGVQVPVTPQPSSPRSRPRVRPGRNSP